MPVYKNTEQLIQTMRTLFGRMAAENPDISKEVSSARLIIRFQVTQPGGTLTLNGRHNPVQVSYEPSPLKPDIQVELSGDALHHILLGDLALRAALGNGQMNVKGAILKSFVLADVFHQCQALYPQVAAEAGLITSL
jgi:hypothetical protein